MVLNSEKEAITRIRKREYGCFDEYAPDESSLCHVLDLSTIYT